MNTRTLPSPQTALWRKLEAMQNIVASHGFQSFKAGPDSIVVVIDEDERFTCKTKAQVYDALGYEYDEENEGYWI